MIVALAGGAGAMVFLSNKDAETTLTVEQAADEMKGIFVLPKAEQLAKWREWATAPGNEGGISEIKQEALKQLAWAGDAQGVDAAIAALKSPEEKLQSMAATVLAHFFGSDAVRFCTTSEGLPCVTRSFGSFWAAAEEAGWSRIYGGIHWDFDNLDGLAAGRALGDYVAGRFLLPEGRLSSRWASAVFATRRRER